MKIKLLLFVFSAFMLFAQGVGATDYYFSSENGDDGNAGTSSGAPKQTISAMQTVINSLSAGDRIYLERGSVWYETNLKITSKNGTSGSPIVFDAYGSGANPVLSGQKILSSPSQSGNIYTFTDGDIPDINLTTESYGTRMLGYVTVGGQEHSAARHPNDSYYLSGSTTYNSLTEDDLSWSTNQWQNAWIAIKSVKWQWSVVRVTSNTSNVLSTTEHCEHTTIFPVSGQKIYYFVNAYSAMDVDGEWYWNNGTLSVYWSSGSLPQVKASVVDTIVGLTNSDYIYFNHIDFVGANHYGISIYKGEYNKVDNCRIIGAGEFGVSIYSTDEDVSNSSDTKGNEVTNSEVADCNLGGIFSRHAGGGNFSNNYVHRIAIDAGCNNKSENRSNDGYAIQVWNNHLLEVTIQQNFIDSVQSGITTHYTSGNMNIRGNFIRNYGIGDLGDNAGFYTVSDTYSSVSKRICRNFFLDVKEPVASARHLTQWGYYSDDYTHAMYFDQDSYAEKGDSNSIENAQMALYTNGGKYRSFNYNNILNPITHSSMLSSHRATILNSYSIGPIGSGSFGQDTFKYNNVVFDALGEAGYSFSRLVTYGDYHYSCALPEGGEVDYNNWFDPYGTSSSKVGSRSVDYNPTSYTLSAWQAYSDNCSGDTNDPGDNSTYNDSYSDAILLKNWSASSHTFTLSANYVDVDGNTVTGSTSVPAFYSKLLFKTSGTETNSDLYADTTLVPNLTSTIVGGSTGGTPTQTVTISATDATATEASTTTGTYRISRGSATSGAMTVNFSTSGTATLTTDYSLSSSSSVTISDGNTYADVTLTPVNDAIDENDETAILTVTSGTGYTVGSPSSATVTIVDDDTTASSDTIAHWRFENNANDETGVHDATLYGSPTYYSPGGEGSYGLNLDGSGRYANCDTITLGDSFTISGYYLIWGTSGTRALFGTTTSSSPDGILATVNLSTGVLSLITGDGSSSATATSTSGNHTSGSWVKFKFIVDRSANTCNIEIDDTDESSSTTIEGDFTDGKTFYIGQDSGGGTRIWGRVDGYLIVGEGGTSTPQSVSVNGYDYAFEDGETTAYYEISRGNETSGNLTVNYSLSGTATLGSDYSVSPSGSVTILDGNTYAQVALTAIDDTLSEVTEVAEIRIASGSGYTYNENDYATIYIYDDEVQTVNIVLIDAGAYEENEDTAVYRVSRGLRTSGDLTVNLAVSGTATLNSDYTLSSSSSSVTISDGTSYTHIILTPEDDAIVEDIEYAIITLNSGTGYLIGNASYQTVSIVDNDELVVDTIGKINFAYTGYAETGWTNIYGSDFDESLGDGVSISTDYSFSMGSSGEPSTVFPSNVGSTYNFMFNTNNNPAYITVSGLDTASNVSYRFSFFESRDDGSASGDRTTTYTIGSESVGTNPVGNTSTVLTIDSVAADASGEVEITVTKITDQYGYINAMIIEEVTESGESRAILEPGQNLGNALSEIEYYPVPVESQLNLKNVPVESMISVYDVVGNKVYQMKSGLGNDLQLDMSKFRSGMYLVRIVNELSSNVNAFKVLKK